METEGALGAWVKSNDTKPGNHVENMEGPETVNKSLSHLLKSATITDCKVTNLDKLDSEELNDEFEIDQSGDRSGIKGTAFSEVLKWHYRLRHTSLGYLKRLHSLDSNLKGVVFDESILDCEVYALVKIVRLPFKSERWKAARPLRIIHSDVMGKINLATHLGRKVYIVSFINDYTQLEMSYLHDEN